VLRLAVMVSTLLHDDDGFSITELLVALVVGSIVLTSLMFVFITGLQATGRVNDRVEAAQRGRLAMDRVTSLLDSQVCISYYDSTAGSVLTIPPVQPTVSTSTSVTFYADLAGSSDTPDRYTVTYDPSAKTLTEYRYASTGTMPNLTFASTPTATRVLSSNVVPARQGGVITGAQLPIFQYYKFTNGAINTTPLATTPSGLSAANAALVVRVDVQFQTTPERTRAEDPRSALLQGQGTISTANPVNNTVC
jgi:prepilin-type N-terminal cleavage/methylation domain-containing protein